METPKIILTKDGSHSLKMSSMEEHYHSTFGAISESRHVFIEAGLKYILTKKVAQLEILEIGMGTGLNVLLTLLELSKEGLNISYTALEPYPLHEEIWRNLNYPEIVSEQIAGEWFEMVHASEWEERFEIIPGFSLDKREIKLQDLQKTGPQYDLIYFDAFGPDVQPEMWTDEVFNKISAMTNKDGVLVTYSAKGTVRRGLQAAGFEVERIPGPEGKRHMLRGFRC